MLSKKIGIYHAQFMRKIFGKKGCENEFLKVFIINNNAKSSKEQKTNIKKLLF